MALKAAYDGDIALFEAIVNTARVDVRSLTKFKSFSVYNAGETFYLVFELVKSGNYAMLKHMVEKYDMSLRVREEHLQALADEHEKRKKWETDTEVGRRIASMYVHDAGARFLAPMTPYRGADSLVEYATQLLTTNRQECEVLRKGNRAEELTKKEIAREQILTCLDYVQEKLSVPAHADA
jgi:hypothetical protein